MNVLSGAVFHISSWCDLTQLLAPAAIIAAMMTASRNDMFTLTGVSQGSEMSCLYLPMDVESRCFSRFSLIVTSFSGCLTNGDRLGSYALKLHRIITLSKREYPSSPAWKEDIGITLERWYDKSDQTNRQLPIADLLARTHVKNDKPERRCHCK